MYPADNVLQGNGKTPLALSQQTNNTSPANNNNTIIANSVTNNNNNNNVQVNNTNVSTPTAQQVLGGSDDLRYHGTELVMLYDYKVH